MVETDENGESLIRFGNGTNGKLLPEHARVSCEFQYGAGLAGNVGLDKIVRFDAGTLNTTPLGGDFTRCWNPLDVTDGRAPEPAAEIVRRVPEAYRARQLRAVTLQDYVNRAQQVPGVSRAAASYAWTGSWRTVRVTIDPVGGTELEDSLRRDVARYLEAVRLIGKTSKFARRCSYRSTSALSCVPRPTIGRMIYIRSWSRNSPHGSRRTDAWDSFIPISGRLASRFTPARSSAAFKRYRVSST